MTSRRNTGLRGSPIKYAAILRDLRERILRGAARPGERLPTCAQLMQQYGTTKATVLKALDVLAREGLTRADGRRGTFVTASSARALPYALVFPWPREEGRSNFFDGLRREAERLDQAGKPFSMFFEIGGQADTGDYQRLLGAVQGHTLIGIIFAAHPYLLRGLPILDALNVPRVAVMAPDRSLPFPSVYPDTAAFLPKAFAHLAVAGRRRVAVVQLATHGDPAAEVGRCRTLAAKYGLEISPEWVQGVHPSTHRWAEQVVQAMFHAPVRERPDALVITDDNLVPAATAGLTASVGASTSVLVIAQTNFPQPTPSALPVVRLGYDLAALMALCVDQIDRQRRGVRTRRVSRLPPVFETELGGPRLGRRGDKE